MRTRADKDRQRMRSHRVSRSRILALVVTAVVAVAGVATIAPGRGAASIGTGVGTITTQLGYQGGEQAGTRIVVTSSGEVLTHNHVLANATSLRVSVPGTGHSYRGHVVGYDVRHDVAVVRLLGASNLTTASLDPAVRVSIGQKVRAVGNAGGTGSLKSAYGRVTGTGKSITAADTPGNSERLGGLIQTNAGAGAGGSGGPAAGADGPAIRTAAAASPASRRPLGF